MARKVAIYIRISTQLQYADRQHEELRLFADNQGFDVVDDYVDIMSGFKDEEYRPELNRLLEDCKLHKFDLVLFSEFSRLSRKIGDLNNMIDKFRENNIELYFQKQNQWVRRSGDLGTDILIQVLGVVSSYEIELFAERSISGKISAIKNRGVNLGGLTAYGYKSEKSTKRLIVNADEAAIVLRVFEMYSNGYKQQQICDILKAENVPSPYKSRLAESTQKREQLGLKAKEYKSLDKDSLVWTASSLNKILKNRLYLGERNVKIHKPDPTSSIPISKRKNREVLTEINQIDESLRIIEESLFDEVQLKLKANSQIKETPTKHPTLLKSVLRCGCCGRNFVSARANGDFKYMCYGKIKDRKTRQINCVDSLEYTQYKLDGLVVQLVIYRLADTDRARKSEQKINELTEQKVALNKVLSNKLSDLEDEKSSWYTYFSKATRYDIPDSQVDARKEEFTQKSHRLNQEVGKLNNELRNIDRSIKSIETLVKSPTLKQQQYEILNNKILLKNLIDEYVERVLVYPIFDKYSLIIVSLKDGGEVWGTIKSARYRNEELWLDPVYCTQPHYKYQLWVNDDKSAKYDHNTKMVAYEPTVDPDPYVTFGKGMYSIRDFMQLLKGSGNEGNFTTYNYHQDEPDFEVNRQKELKHRKINVQKAHKKKIKPSERI